MSRATGRRQRARIGGRAFGKHGRQSGPAPVRRLEVDAAGTTARATDISPQLRYFATCLREAHLRSAEFRTNRAGRQYVTPWIGREALFHDGATRAACQARGREAQRLSDFAARVEGRLLVYGYPVFVDGGGRARALIDAPARLEPAPGGGDPEVVLHGPALPNAALLRRLGVAREAVVALQERMLADPAPSFATMLSAICDVLGLTADRFDADGVVAPPLARTDDATEDWVNAAVLFATEPTPGVDDALEDCATLAIAGGGVAGDGGLASLLQPEPGARAQSSEAEGAGGTDPAAAIDVESMMLDLHGLDDSQRQAVAGAFARPLSMVLAPPGCGRLETVANLIGNAVLRDLSVLYVAPDDASIDQLERRLAPAVTTPYPHLVRLESDPESATRRVEALLASLHELSEDLADLEEDNARALEARELATLQTLREIAGEQAQVQDEIEQVRAAHAALIDETLGGSGAARPELSAGRLRSARDAARAVATGGLKARLGAASKVEELMGVYRRVERSVPNGLRAELRAVLGRQPGAAELAKAFDRLLKMLDDAPGGRLDARAALARAPDAAALGKRWDLLARRYRDASSEILRTEWLGRLTTDPDETYAQCRALFTVLERWRALGEAAGPSGVVEVELADRIAEALPQATASLAVWCVRQDAASSCLPLRPNLFDLVIVDRAELLAPAMAVPLLSRGRAGALFFREPHVAQRAPLPDTRAAQLAAEAGLSAGRTPLPDGVHLLDLAAHAAEAAGHGPTLLCDQRRGHPQIVAYLSQAGFDGRLVSRADVAAVLRDYGPAFHGLHLRTGGGPNGVLELLDAWNALGVFERVPRARIGVLLGDDAEVRALRRDLVDQPRTAVIGRRATFLTPEALDEQEFDLVVVAPPRSVPTDCAASLSEVQIHALLAAAGSARAGCHVVALPEETTDDALADLLGDANAPGAQVDSGAVDRSALEAEIAELDRAFGRATPDAADEAGEPDERVDALLRERGLWVRRDARVAGQLCDFRVRSPFGADYAVLLADDAQNGDDSLARRRLQALAEAGVQVVQLTPDTLAGDAALAGLLLDRIV